MKVKEQVNAWPSGPEYFFTQTAVICPCGKPLNRQLEVQSQNPRGGSVNTRQNLSKIVYENTRFFLLSAAKFGSIFLGI
jgi:hypothetical protein